MNKPLAFICACIAGIGIVSLGCSIYFTIAYGHGNMEAGNFNRCWYSTTRDAQTGQIVREWDVRGESTEDNMVDRLDMWFAGIAFVVTAVGIYVGGRTRRHLLERD